MAAATTFPLAQNTGRGETLIRLQMIGDFRRDTRRTNEPQFCEHITLGPKPAL